ncbi:F-box only protein 30-like [Clavelina lepadiformis]|uniref:F-box only protein 30-like n=1 Tax=Clavelina lepadiformis TaxID=159417 RepID=UPI004042C9AF
MSENDLHEHCTLCFKKICTDKFKEVCKVVPCKNNCGFVMHKCKEVDHLEICPSSSQPCVNSLNGCPFTLPRGSIGNHLEICPASVVVCTMEWNRKPVSLQESIAMENFDPNQTIFNNFEVALALRDQRVLLESVVPEKEMHDIFDKDSLTRKSIFANNDSSDILEKTSYDGSTDVVKGLLVNGETESIVGDNDLKNNIGKDVANANKVSVDSTSLQLNEEQTPKRKPLLRRRFQLSPKKEYKNKSCDTSDLNIDMSNQRWLNPGVKILANEPITSIFEMIGAYEKRERISSSHHSEGLRCSYSETRLCSYRHVAAQTRPFFDVNKHIGKIGSAVQEDFSHRLNDTSHIDKESHNKLLYTTLALNRVMECLPRYERKSRSIYSFMCNHILRRDQFQAHFQNVHCDIYSALDGWLEQKCPYTAYGCTYSQLRLCPGNSENQLIFDNVRSCLAVTLNRKFNPADSIILNNESSDLALLDMPWEILEHILSYLDSYSFGQVAQSCSLLRDVCLTHLKDRGVVSLRWEKIYHPDSSSSWQVTGHRWSFTNSFSKISKWAFNKVPNINGHMQSCRFAESVRRSYTGSDAKRVKVIPVYAKSD